MTTMLSILSLVWYYICRLIEVSSVKLCPDVLYLYRIRCRCIRDPKRFLWATTKTLIFMWFFVSVVFLIANIMVIVPKWTLCSLPRKRVSATVKNMEKICARVKWNREVLPYVMRARHLFPIIYQIVVTALFTLLTYGAVLMDHKHLVHICGYIWANLWYFDIYLNMPVLFHNESRLYSMHQIWILGGFTTLFIYCGTLHSGYHLRRIIYPGDPDPNDKLIDPNTNSFINKYKAHNY